jgi:RHS repeat-associated protein
VADVAQESGGDANTDAGDESAYGNQVLYCGYRHDRGPDLYHVRHRMLHPKLGRWMQRDPVVYVDGMHLYRLYGLDSSGLSIYTKGRVTIKPPPRSAESLKAELVEIMARVGKTEADITQDPLAIPYDLALEEANVKAQIEFNGALASALRTLCPCVAIKQESSETKTELYAEIDNKAHPEATSFCNCVCQHAAGCTLVHDLLISKDVIEMSRWYETEGEKNGLFTARASTSSIDWNPGYPGTDSVPHHGAHLVLGHELTHAWNHYNPSKREVRDLAALGSGGVPHHEEFAVRAENQLKVELNAALPAESQLSAADLKAGIRTTYEWRGALGQVDDYAKPYFAKPDRATCEKWYGEVWRGQP